LSAETPAVQRKSTLTTTEKPHLQQDHILIPDDASALATLAPDTSVRAPTPPQRDSFDELAAELSSPHSVRSLEDWEVEDFVLLATVDGDLYATDRKTGTVLWHTEVEKPVVETVHYRSNMSVVDEGYKAVDHFIWAVEPNNDGRIFFMPPEGMATGLTATQLTMKGLVALSPYVDRQSSIAYLGQKESTAVYLDAETGSLRALWSASDPRNTMGSFQAESCRRPNEFDDSAECPVGGTIILGRTDYTVTIYRTDLPDRPAIATLKYSDWTPNTWDGDLHQQYQSKMDNQYITSKPDGQVYAVSTEKSRSGDKAFNLQYRLSAPICRVFDLARPKDTPAGTNPELVVLPRPPPPPENEAAASLRETSIFMNATEGGNWYALSGAAYPLVVNAAEAQCTTDGWWDENQGELDPLELQKALVGKHSLRGGRGRRRTLDTKLQTLPGWETTNRYGGEETEENGSSVPIPSPETDEPPVGRKFHGLPQAAAKSLLGSLLDFVKNPFVFLIFLGLVVSNFRTLKRRYHDLKHPLVKNQPLEHQQNEEMPTVTQTKPVDNPTNITEIQQSDVSDREAPLIQKNDALEDPATKSRRNTDASLTPPDPEAKNQGDTTLQQPPVVAPTESGNAEAEAQPKKRKTHRGQRGGRTHKKKKPGNSENGSPPPQARDKDGETVGQALDYVVPKVPEIAPDLITSGDVQQMEGSILKIGNLEINEERQLGTGSNGTIVYAGKLGAREVAVKRMLVQFYDIASQETKLLSESDNDPNGKSSLNLVRVMLADCCCSDPLLHRGKTRPFLLHRSGTL
jgi:serine/threonine-protein kinase/endoribonuclease IRE1